MKDKTISKLRNKFWLFIAGSVTLLMVFTLMVIYLSYSTFQYQRRQNMINTWTAFAPRFNDATERVLREPQWDEIIIIGDLDEPLYISSLMEVTTEEARQLLLAARMATGHQRFRDRFLWRVPFPIVEFRGRNYMFSNDILEEETFTRIFFFQDISDLEFSLQRARHLLIMAGIGGFITVVFLSFGTANLLVKPTRDAFDKQQRFITDASHELKTPLTIIKSNYSVLMASKDKTIRQQLKWLGNLEFGINRMDHLLRELLQLSKVDFTSVKEAVDLTQQLDSLLASLNPQIVEKKLHVQTQLEPIIILQNREKMIQLLTILVDNAIKYSNESGRLNITLSKSRNQAVLTVANTGTTIPPEKLPFIFDRFYRVDESRNSRSDSFGLGLAIALAIVEGAAGKISCASEKGETVFTVSLPLR